MRKTLTIKLSLEDVYMRKSKLLISIAATSILGAGAITLPISFNQSNKTISVRKNTENIGSNLVSELNSAHINGNVTINYYQTK